MYEPTYVKEGLKSSLKKFYSRYENLNKNNEGSVSWLCTSNIEGMLQFLM